MTSPRHLLPQPQSRVFYVTKIIFNIYNCVRGTFALYAFCFLLYKTVFETSFLTIDNVHQDNTVSYQQLLLALPVFIVEVILFISGFIGVFEYNVNSLKLYSIILTVSSIIYVAWTFTSTLTQTYTSTGEMKVNIDIVLFTICLTSELWAIFMSCVLIHYISLVQEPQLTACDTICGTLFAIL